MTPGKQILGYAANILVGLSGWIIVFFAMRAHDKNKKNRLVKSILDIGMLIGFGLPILLGSLIHKNLPGGRNPLKWAPHSSLAFAVAVVSPMSLLVIGMIRSAFHSFRAKRRLKERFSGTRRPVDLSGAKEGYSVLYSGLEVLEDPANGERIGAGKSFNDQFLEKVTMGSEFPSFDKSLKKKRCPKCRASLSGITATDSTLEATYHFEGMREFKKKVSGPMIPCPKCSQKIIADYEAYSEAEEEAIEKGKLVLIEWSRHCPRRSNETGFAPAPR